MSYKQHYVAMQRGSVKGWLSETGNDLTRQAVFQVVRQVSN